jgi:hypothetical protein
MPARSLDDCLRTSGLARFASHAERLLRLQRLLEGALPRPLARAARVANFRQGRIFIHTDSGAIAAKLKQITPTLSTVFRNAEAEVTGIEVRVQPGPVKGQARRKDVRPPPGHQQKQGLASLAAGLPDDAPLKKVLERLTRG